MGLETATYINGLITTNPTSSDPKSQGDDHLRLVKSTVKATFPNITGAVTPTQADLNVLAGAAAGSVNLTVASLTDSGNLTFTGTGNRITGDFSNATASNRVAFQSSTANSNTTVEVLPNGTATTSALLLESDSANTLGANLQLNMVGGIDARIASGVRGAGTYLPMTFWIGGSERVRVDTSGNVGIGTISPTTKLTVFSATNAGISVNDGTVNTIIYNSTGGVASIGTTTNHPVSFYANNAERMRIDASGNVGIGTSSPASYAGYAALTLNNTTGAVIDLNVNAIRSATATINATGFIVGSISNVPLALWTNGSEKIRVTTGGDVTVSTAALLGYGTGSGGTVTQATSKSTAVTLNKPTGQITMNNAALAAGASIDFQMLNSLVTTSDIVICNVISYSNYTVGVKYVTAGNIYIRITNVSAGSLSEPVIINFAIIKGSLT